MIRPRPHALPRSVSVLLCVTALLSLALLCGCQSAPWQGFPAPSPQAPRWPQPPAPARVTFVTEFNRHQDIFTERGFGAGLKRLFAGEVDSRIGRPYALALHPDGGLLITDTARACVHGYFWTDGRYRRYGGDDDASLPSPVGVASLPGGDVLVSDSRLGKLVRFSRDGAPLGPFAEGVPFQRPAGLAIDPVSRQVFVADVLRHQIAVLDLSGALKYWIGERGAEPGQFNFPTHLALLPGGDLAVTDSMNFRIQRLAPDGRPRLHVGRLGNAPGTFSKPKGVALTPAGRLIAVEGLHDALQFFAPDGQLLLSVGQSGNAPGQFWLPAGLCYDPSNHLIFVADSYNQRIQVFRLDEEPRP